MSETIPAIYERGLLRPLIPLLLPERARVHIQIVAPDRAGEQERQRVYQVLAEAGIIRPQPQVEPAAVSEAQLEAAAWALAAAGPLSEQIIAERDER